MPVVASETLLRAVHTLNGAIAMVDKLLRERRNGQPLQIGAVGLGAGTVAAYAHAGDDITFYELDPKMRDLAQQSLAI